MANYYVDSSRPDDTGDGLTEETAWKTVTKVNDSMSGFNAGDIVSFKCGEVFHDVRLQINKDGADGNPIIFNSYGTGSKPRIDMSEVKDSFTDLGGGEWQGDTGDGIRLFRDNVELYKAVDDTEFALSETEWIDDGDTFRIKSDPAGSTFLMTGNTQNIYCTASNITIDGLDLFGGDNSILADGAANLTIINNIIGYGSKDGINITGTTAGLVITKNIIDSGLVLYYGAWSQVGGTYRGNQNGIYIRDTCIDGDISRNFVKNWQHAGIDLLGSGDIGTTNIRHNVFTSPDLSYSRGMSLSLNFHHSEIYNNYIEDTATQCQIGGHDNYTHHNIWNTTRNGDGKDGATGHTLGFDSGAADIVDNLFENNIFYLGESGALHMQGYSDSDILRNSFNNNVFFTDNTEYTLSFRNYAFDPSNTFSNNVIYDATKIGQAIIDDFNGDLTVAQFNADARGADNLEVNPSFVDLIDFVLSEGSPAIGTGLLPTAIEDYAGNTITNGGVGSGYDISVYNQAYTGVTMTGITEIKLGFDQAVLDDFRARALAQYV